MKRDVVMARTRHGYDSYLDFWRLAEASSLPVVYVDEIDPADDTKTYIFTPINGEVVLERWKNRRAKIVWWNLERWEDETREKSMQAVAGCVDAVWTSDRWIASKDSRLSYVLLAGHRKFGRRVLDRQYDVCPLAYLWGRRKDLVDGLRGCGLKIAPEAWTREQKDMTVARSHLVLNMHQYEGMQVVAPLRFAVAASYAIPLVSETFADQDARSQVYRMLPMSQLVSAIVTALQYPDQLRVAGARLFDDLCMITDFGLQVRYEASKL